jgi:ferrous iron transport protein B
MLTVLFIMFQAVFWIAEHPMGWIESGFGAFTSWLESRLPDNWLGSLVIDGIVAGLGGILVFVPQIMILFGMITFLEDTGYMARIGFLTDRLMRKVGLNGKSVMPMISGFACAVPAIMSARNIENSKERLLTILATPLMSCSARLPVYTVLVGLVIPKKNILGFLNLQGLVMLGLYLLGLLVALIMSFLFNLFIRMREKSVFILEMPVYRAPRWKNILLTMVQKARIFVMDAGKVIMVISIVLWALSSFGPSAERESIRVDTEARISEDPGKKASLEAEMKARMLENSYAGLLGRKIEPLIEPLGFDWKIGIALITSFAAREVFVGTMATLYSVGGDPEEDDSTLREKMSAAVRSDGSRVYDLATGVSLMIFYVFAMQCMSTLAIVKKETGGWKWPIIMFLYMTGIAYFLGMFSHWIIGSFSL